MPRLNLSFDFLRTFWRDKRFFVLLAVLLIALGIFLVSRTLPNVDTRVCSYFYSLVGIDLLFLLALPRQEDRVRTVALVLMVSLEIVMVTYLVLVTLLGGR